jgi:hypothetical protein
VHDPGRSGEPIEDMLDAGPNLLTRGPLTSRWTARSESTCEIEQIRPFDLVELQGPSKRVEHTVGDTLEVSTFDACVIGGADAGQDGNLLAAQPRDPTAAIGGQTHLVRGDLGPAGGQELSDLASCVH